MGFMILTFVFASIRGHWMLSLITLFCTEFECFNCCTVNFDEYLYVSAFCYIDPCGTNMNMEWNDGKPELCVNCNALFEPGFDPVRQISVSFHKYSDSEEEDEAENERNVSILDALSSVFNSTALIQLQKSELANYFSMCFKCAQTLSNLYEAYIELLTFSDPAARISKLMHQIELWHQKQGIFVPSEDVEIKEEVDTDLEDDSQEFDYTVPTVEFGLSNSNHDLENENDWNSNSGDRFSDEDPLNLDEHGSVRKKFDKSKYVPK